MNDERLEIARRFVACPGWVWLPGMSVRLVDRVDVCFRLVGIVGCGTYGYAAGGADGLCSIALPVCLPDLDDPVAAAGILPVVRRARNEPNGSLMPVVMQNGNVETVAYYPVVEGRRPFYAPSELLALLAALEAAPK